LLQSKKQRRLLKAFLRQMGRADLIGNGKLQLVPAYQPPGTGDVAEGKRDVLSHRPFKTQRTGLPKVPAVRRRGRDGGR
jgi:hypothetical protein